MTEIELGGFLTMLLLSVFVKFSVASVGDRSNEYNFCLTTCQKRCIQSNMMFNQPLHLKLLGWDCYEECKYICMWSTVKKFQHAQQAVPQFHGKWPFIRIFGIQEPASVVFSILNGVTSSIGFYKVYQVVPNTAPMYNIMVVHFITVINAWIWSSVFHSRDFMWTEELDYFCATSLIIFTFYLIIYRWTYHLALKKRKYIRWLIAVALLSIYLGHISYLHFVKFDYGYNMMFNVAIGITNCMLSIIFWYSKKDKLLYVWKLPTVGVLSSMFLCFELLDFPPILWVFDAHSIWHFSTIPIPLLFYSYVKDDLLYLINA